MLKGRTPETAEAILILAALLFVAGVGVVGGFVGYEIGSSEGSSPGAAVAAETEAVAPDTEPAPAGTETGTTTAEEPTTSGEEPAEPAGETTAPAGDATAGKQIFADAGCGSCHTLAAAGATGLVGPDLDQAKPSFVEVVSIVSSGFGAMPGFSGSLSESEIEDLAAFVVEAVGGGSAAQSGSIAGGDGATADGNGAGNGATADGGSSASGSQVFAQAGCGGCHTLAAAGASGQVGPNLDQARPSAARVASIVTSGGGGMPGYSGRLSPSEINALAAFVAGAAGGSASGGTGQNGTPGTTTPKPVELVLNDGRLSGGSGLVPAGKTTFSVRNAGGSRNWFAVLRSGTSNPVFLGTLQNVPPGQRAILTLTLSQGTYLLACCSQPGKLGGGMFSTLTVGP